MDQPQTLPRLPKVAPDTAFEALRSQGIRQLQALAGEVWTDYNLHDPGVTLLEALCFALTELSYRADFDVADHLADAQDRIDWARHALHLPAQAFPCRPTTALDLRRWLLDQVPALEGVTLDSAPRHGVPPGVMPLLLDATDGAITARLPAQVRRAAARKRNLGEELGEVRLLQRHRCQLLGEISIGGAREPAEIVAELHESCAAYVSAAVDFDAAGEALARGLPLDQVYEGPPTERGVAQPHRLERALQPTLFVADLIARVRATPGVLDVAWLALQPQGGAPAGASLPWRDLHAGWTLVLDPPAGAGVLSGLAVLRRGSPVELSAREVRRCLAERRAGRQSRRHGQRALDATAPDTPHGRHRPAPVHFPLQHQLPGVYAVGENGLPDSARPAEKARARQLQGYLALLDQRVAHGGAQLAHLRDLFSTDSGHLPSYRWQVLGEAQVPGLATLLRAPPEAIESRLCQPVDEREDRRSRMLDVLLALHGHSYPQNSLRQFCDHLAPGEREAALLANKQAFAQQVVDLSCDRASGFDWTQASWNQPGNNSALQRRTSLLLGFPHGHSRALSAALQRRKLVAGETFQASSGVVHRVDRPPQWQTLDLGSAAGRRAAAAPRPALQRLAIVRSPQLPAALLRCATRHDRYGVAPEPGGGLQLLLGPDEDGAHWLLDRVGAGEAGPLEVALSLAAGLRRFALKIDGDAEGLHLVEHVLLRPVGGAATHEGVPAAFFALQLSAVFPDWTQRCHRPAFRQLAEETVQINTPAHLLAHCLWLDVPAMAAFETAFEAWLQARQHWGQAPEQPARCPRLDEAAGALARLLWERLADRVPGAATDAAGGSAADDDDDDDAADESEFEVWGEVWAETAAVGTADDASATEGGR